MLRDDAAADDAVQETFLSAFKAIARFDHNARLGTWLHRIAVNACLMRLRTARRKPERAIDPLLPTFLPDGHATHPAAAWNLPPSAGIETRETQALVRTRIDELPDHYREVLLLRDIEELSTEETATLLGETQGAVKVRLHRARQALRTLLEPHFATPSPSLPQRPHTAPRAPRP